MTQQQTDKPEGEAGNVDGAPTDDHGKNDGQGGTVPDPQPDTGGGDTEGQPDYGGN